MLVSIANNISAVIDGDTIKFGQSVRVYVLRGVSADGNSAPLKKTWPRVKLKAPSVSNIIPKLPTRPKYRASVTKLINTSCYVTITDEKLEEYCKCVQDFNEEERKEFADFLVDKFEARYEFYATQVRNSLNELGKMLIGIPSGSSKCIHAYSGFVETKYMCRRFRNKPHKNNTAITAA